MPQPAPVDPAVEAAVAKTRFLFRLGRPQARLDMARDLVTRWPSEFRAHAELGNVLHHQRLFRDAVEVFRAAAALYDAPAIWRQALASAVEVGDNALIVGVLQDMGRGDIDTTGLRAVMLGERILFVDPARTSNPILRSMLTGNYEAPERASIQNLVKPFNRVLELGAACGAVSTLIADVVGDDKLVCVEANAGLLPALRATLAANGHRPTIINAAVVGSEAACGPDRTIEFDFASEYWAGSTVRRSAGPTERVEAVIVDELIAEHRVDTIIADIEGGEYELTFGSDLPGVKTLVMEFHLDVLGEEKILAMFDRLVDLGFSIRSPNPGMLVATR